MTQKQTEIIRKQTFGNNFSYTFIIKSKGVNQKKDYEQLKNVKWVKKLGEERGGCQGLTGGQDGL